jgi:hypothetical protein
MNPMPSSCGLRKAPRKRGKIRVGEGLANWRSLRLRICFAASFRVRAEVAFPWLMLLIPLSARVGAERIKPMDAWQASDVATQRAKQDSFEDRKSAEAMEMSAPGGSAKSASSSRPSKLIVVGFMGGRVSAMNMGHREAQLIHSLQEDYPLAMHAAIFANRDGDRALKGILDLLDEDGNGRLSDAEKNAARIVIFGHSWGASEAVTLADRLDKLAIPVLLTIQVDSVRKQNQNDEEIPPNVREAVNFYQSEGMLRGRSSIVAMDPSKTRILGNYESSYRGNAVSCAGYPWYARAFMRRHIQIENDPAVWSRIEELIVSKLQ